MKYVRSLIEIMAFATAAGWSCGALAAPQQLDCVLTDADTKRESVNRSIVVIFDEEKKNLTAKEGNHTYSLGKVSISNVSVSGQADDISLGIDRSAFSIVWQR